MIGLWAWRRPVALKQPISDLLLGTTSWLGARRVFVPGCESSRLTSAVLLPGKRHLPGGPRRRRSANRNWRDRSAPDEADRSVYLRGKKWPCATGFARRADLEVSCPSTH